MGQVLQLQVLQRTCFGNTPSHDPEELKLNSTIIANNGIYTITNEKVAKI